MSKFHLGQLVKLASFKDDAWAWCSPMERYLTGTHMIVGIEYNDERPREYLPGYESKMPGERAVCPSCGGPTIRYYINPTLHTHENCGHAYWWPEDKITAAEEEELPKVDSKIRFKMLLEEIDE